MPEKRRIFRPIAEVGSLDPPPPLEDNLVWPGGHVLLYGYGSAGKGVDAAWIAAQRTKRGLVVAVLDYENNPDEWRSRHKTFGGNEELLYIETPAPTGLLRGPIWTQEDEISAAVAEISASLVIVDSVVPATQVSAEHIGSPEHPSRYRHALDVIGTSSLSLGHAAGAPSEKNLVKPWGSNFWPNTMRLTISAWYDAEKKVQRLAVVKRNRHRKRRWEIPWAWADELEDGETPTDLDWAEVSPDAAKSQRAAEKMSEIDKIVLRQLKREATDYANKRNTNALFRTSEVKRKQDFTDSLKRLANRPDMTLEERADFEHVGQQTFWWYLPSGASQRPKTGPGTTAQDAAPEASDGPVGEAA